MDEEPNDDVNTNLMLLQCRTLERLLGGLPRPRPPQNEVLDILKANVRLFGAFIGQDVQNVKNKNKSGNKNRAPRPVGKNREKKKRKALALLAADTAPVPLMNIPVPLPSGLDVESLPSIVQPTPTCHSARKRSKKSKSESETSDLPAVLEVAEGALAYERDEPSTQMEFFEQAYIKMFKLDPKTLLPFKPSNRYPKGYVIAGYDFPDGRVSNGLFVGNILLLGDAFVHGIERRVCCNKTYGADEALCNKNLSISQLTETLNTYPRLPENVLLSIGTTDAGLTESLIQIRRQYGSLLQTLGSKGVTKLRVLPVITVPGMSVRYEEMAAIVAADWSIPFGGEYIYEKDVLQPLLDSFKQPLEFQYNSYIFLPKQWRQIADTIRLTFDPSSASRTAESVLPHRRYTKKSAPGTGLKLDYALRKSGLNKKTKE
ncbi:uncharacterized protein LOC135842225 [Planococcus citri]|uniref:uncharacterized protein LOC135842225 n=1 Tax=Planococcus citri TaxID=170843 RepID=UPI0031F778BD